MNLEKYLGIKWLSGGRDVNFGIDCWGLLRHVYYNEFQVSLPEYPVPEGSLAATDFVTNEEINSNAWFETDSPVEGDVVVLGTLNSLSHVGVYVETPEPSVLHIGARSSSAIVTLRSLERFGYNKVKYYRHVDRHLS